MIDPSLLTSEFCELVRIDSLSGEEAAVAEVLVAKLQAMGLTVERDDAGAAIGGQCGNIIARLPANDPARPTLMLNAHMDTVKPGQGIQPIVDGDIIRTDGTTILGADDKAGVSIILAGLREIIAANVPHGDLEVVITIAEEIGLFGALYLDYSRIRSQFALVFDGGRERGIMTTAAPAAAKLTFEVAGVAAHAGVCPEKGSSAIIAASRAIAGMKLGRLDDETTSNIGIIQGGAARNIVPDHCRVDGEARSHDPAKLAAQIAHMRECFARACAEVPGTSVQVEEESSYRSFNLAPDDPLVVLVANAARALGIEPRMEVGGGGSDANVFNARGIPAIILATGPSDVHTLQESVAISKMIESAQWLVEAVRQS
jgi:tripeptide aminopeptidase